MFKIRLYANGDDERWNEFVRQSKNGTFLFDRRYMSYHSDRFADCSLMIYHAKDDGHEKLMALLPANRRGNVLVSHGGLTYGGLVMSHDMTVELCTALFGALNDYLRSCGIERVVYRPTPWIYHSMPSEEDLYALVGVCKARLTAREVSSTILLGNRPKMSKLRHRCANKALRQGVVVRESDDLAAFWQILDGNLMTCHGVHPVHTLDEMTLLRSRFTDNIRLFMAFKDEQPLGGTLVYECGQVIHTQYISATPEGKAMGALDLLFSWLIDNRYSDRKYLDFGKSTEQQGRWLNTGLIHQKEGFGGRALCYDTYEWAP